MKKYFELNENGNIQYGVVDNIPEDVTLEQVKDRIESSDNTTSIVIIDEIVLNPDIIFDWNTIDYEQGYDTDYMDVLEYISLAISKEIETDVVYTALKSMKENPSLSISDAIKLGYNLK
jgi:hypothetical protein